jgi:hypothetical protein
MTVVDKELEDIFVPDRNINVTQPSPRDVASVEAKTDDVPEMEKGLACGTPAKPRVTILTREMLAGQRD